MGATLAVALCTGCRYQVVRIDVGSPPPEGAYQSIELGQSQRGDVLDALGAPIHVRYTPREEVLEFEFAQRRGTDLEFILPTAAFAWGPIISTVNSALTATLPSDPNPGVPDQIWVFRVAEFLWGQALSFAPLETGGADTVSLFGRRALSDRIEVVLDRSRGVVVRKSYEAPISAGSGSLIRESFLAD